MLRGGHAFVMGGARNSDGITGGPLKGGEIYGSIRFLIQAITL